MGLVGEIKFSILDTGTKYIQCMYSAIGISRSLPISQSYLGVATSAGCKVHPCIFQSVVEVPHGRLVYSCKSSRIAPLWPKQQRNESFYHHMAFSSWRRVYYNYVLPLSSVLDRRTRLHSDQELTMYFVGPTT